MKQYLLDSFRYNDWANRSVLKAIEQLNAKEESIKLFSHFISTQNKWFNRITNETDDNKHQWFGEPLNLNELETKWEESINNWIQLIENSTEIKLDNDIVFKRASDGKEMGLSLKDLCLQINYHCIHHRAQINTLISKQGIKPPATDYIFTKLREM